MDVVGSVCTDSGPVMLDKNSGAVSYVRNEIRDVLVYHCMLHQHALMTQTLCQRICKILCLMRCKQLIMSDGGQSNIASFMLSAKKLVLFAPSSSSTYK